MMRVPNERITQLYEEPKLGERERASQTKMVMRLFELWNLTLAQQALCLGLSPNTATNIHKYRTAQAYIPLYRDIQARISLLLIIHKCLKRLFPRNKEIAYSWIARPNRHFDNLTPLEVICRDGFTGLLAVKQYLEQALTL